MICEHCGSEIHYLNVDIFDCYGSDTFIKIPVAEYEKDAVVLDLDPNWCGYELSEDEANDTIECPICGHTPFKNKEIQVYDIVRVVKFKTGGEQNG